MPRFKVTDFAGNGATEAPDESKAMADARERARTTDGPARVLTMSTLGMAKTFAIVWPDGAADYR